VPLAPPTSRPQQQDPAAVGLGYVNYNSAPGLHGSATALTSGVVYLVSLFLPYGYLVTNVVLQSTVAAAGTNPTGFFVGLAGPSGVMVAQSANVAANAALQATGPVALPLSATYTPGVADSTTGLFYVVVLLNGSWGTTQPTFLRTSGVAATAKPLGSNPQPFGTGITTAQTALPANGASIVGGMGTSSSLYMCVGVS
jgi:hypothetical protein